MTSFPTQCILASIPPYPIHKHHPKPHVIKSNSQQQSFPTTQESRRDSKCECFNLYNNLIPYKQAWYWQKTKLNEKKSLIQTNQPCPDSLFVLQHPSVYTMGTGSSEEYLNFDLKDAPFDVHRTERGGEVTYHGPGQIVMYPIINLRNHKMDLHWYLRSLEEVIIRALSQTFSIKASRLEGLTGVWHGNRKLAAIGIRVSQWIAYHGLALNVTTDLTPFRWIVPCGLRNYQVGNVRGLLGEFESFDDSRRKQLCDCDDGQLLDIACRSLINEFSEVFQVGINYESISRLECFDSEPVKHLNEEVG